MHATGDGCVVEASTMTRTDTARNGMASLGCECACARSLGTSWPRKTNTGHTRTDDHLHKYTHIHDKQLCGNNESGGESQRTSRKEG